MRVVLDTNIIVSAYLNEDGQPFRILKLALAGAIDLYASEPILNEYKELLQRKSYSMDLRRAALLFKKIRDASTLVKPAIKLSETTDPDDNIFLECAQSGQGRVFSYRQPSPFPHSLEIHTDCPAEAVHRALGRVALAIQAARSLMNAPRQRTQTNHFRFHCQTLFPMHSK
jgi:uncharacterized protein